MGRFSRFKGDFKYLLLNHFINHIPAWCIRKNLYKMLGLRIGKNSRIGINTIIVDPKKIIIGERTIINENCHLDGRGGLFIGNDTSISFKTIIITGTHDSKNNFEFVTNKTVIKNHVWIGVNAIILNGTTIEDLCVVGAGSVIKGKTETNSVYVGNPAKKIRNRECDGNYRIDYKPFFR